MATYTGDDLPNTLTGGAEDDELYGLGGNDTLDGGAGFDFLDGGTGDDQLIGGTGDDTYVVDSVGDTIVETSTDVNEWDTVQSSVSWTLGDNLEILYLQGYYDGNGAYVEDPIDGTGNALDNTLVGNSANNILSGLGGNDSLEGWGGDDQLLGGDGDDWLDGGDGQDLLSGEAGLDQLYGGLGDDALDGGAGDDILEGNEGNDTLAGGIGDDFLSGGLGSDDYLFAPGDGNDTIDNYADPTLDPGKIDRIVFAAGIATTDVLASRNNDDLVLTVNGTDTITVTGYFLNNDYQVDQVVFADNTIWTNTDFQGLPPTATEGDDYLIDTDNGNTIDALGGNDTVLGNGGNDTLIGGSGNDVLDGGAGDDQLDGGTGDDTLIGGTGNDLLTGGIGSDTYEVDSLDDSIQEVGNPALEVNQVFSSVDWTLGPNLHTLTLTGAAILGTGNELDNTLTGNTWANTLNGGAGADTMLGGNGNDTYVVDNAGDEVFETTTTSSGIDAGGVDTVWSSISYTLGSFIEHLTLEIGAANGTGNGLDNTLTGNAAANILGGGGGNDVLNGGAGNDTMAGGSGNDTYHVDSLGDVTMETGTLATEIDTVVSTVSLSLGANIERLVLDGSLAINGGGNYLNNELIGNAAANILGGGGGNDVLNGGAGNDTMAGGVGKDTFLFASGLSATANRDTITDFSVVDDTIQLDRTFFAKLTSLGTLNNALFRSSTNGAALDANDHILYNTTSGALLYDADGSGAGVATQFATLTTKPAVTAADFVVVA